MVVRVRVGLRDNDELPDAEHALHPVCAVEEIQPRIQQVQDAGGEVAQPGRPTGRVWPHTHTHTHTHTHINKPAGTGNHKPHAGTVVHTHTHTHVHMNTQEVSETAHATHLQPPRVGTVATHWPTRRHSPPKGQQTQD